MITKPLTRAISLMAVPVMLSQVEGIVSRVMRKDSLDQMTELALVASN